MWMFVEMNGRNKAEGQDGDLGISWHFSRDY